MSEQGLIPYESAKPINWKEYLGRKGIDWNGKHIIKYQPERRFPRQEGYIRIPEGKYGLKQVIPDQLPPEEFELFAAFDLLAQRILEGYYSQDQNVSEAVKRAIGEQADKRLRFELGSTTRVRYHPNQMEQESKAILTLSPTNPQQGVLIGMSKVELQDSRIPVRFYSPILPDAFWQCPVAIDDPDPNFAPREVLGTDRLPIFLHDVIVIPGIEWQYMRTKYLQNRDYANARQQLIVDTRNRNLPPDQLIRRNMKDICILDRGDFIRNLNKQIPRWEGKPVNLHPVLYSSKITGK